MTEYTPELGQAVFGNPTGEFAVSEIGKAAISYLLEEISRVYWNTKQRIWEGYRDPSIPGFEVRPYCWIENCAECEKPNLAFDGVEVRWYKYPGRGMSCNRAMSPDEWSQWLVAAMTATRAHDDAVNP